MSTEKTGMREGNGEHEHEQEHEHEGKAARSDRLSAGSDASIRSTPVN